MDGLASKADDALRLDGAVCETIALPADPPRFVPTFYVSVSATGVELNFTYDASTLDRETADGLMDDLARTVRTVAGRPESTVAALFA